ncbi:hypothetical protein FA13DRAFT_709304 [Coprinellus micaceus]|uniref:Uncharacterized protein n=1 Tax=Coprinellus micaceus TaxID=71717 RepID=A0A4Y7TV99_COPMI|nr:hypothetical protein FA13DRAFT_709304 [Coprinellus micaceus]
MTLTTSNTPRRGRIQWLVFRNLSLLVEIAKYMGTKDSVSMALANEAILRDLLRIFPSLRRPIEDERRGREDERRGIEDARRKAEVERRREEDKQHKRKEATTARQKAESKIPPPSNAMEWDEEDLESRQQRLRQAWIAEGHDARDVEKAVSFKVRKNTRMAAIQEKHKEWINYFRARRHAEARQFRSSKLGSIWESWGRSQFDQGEITARGLVSFPKWRNVFDRYPENSAVTVYLDFDPESEPPTEKLLDAFSTLLCDYIDTRREDHRRLILPSPSSGPQSTVDPLELATSVFIPPSRWEIRERKSALTGHAHRSETIFVGWNTLSVLEYTMEAVDATIIPCTFDRWLSSLSSALVTLCNRDPLLATVEEMDKVDERFCCVPCTREAIRLSSVAKGDGVSVRVFTWRAALSHARLDHYGVAPGGIFRLFSQTSNQRHLLGEPLRDHHDVWLCGHCPNAPTPRPVTTNEILRHMRMCVCYYLLTWA